MPADDPAGLGDSLLSELGPAPRLVTDPALFAEPLEHAGDAGSADAEPGRDVDRRHHLLGAAQEVDGFQVVLDGGSQLFHAEPGYGEGDLVGSF